MDRIRPAPQLLLEGLKLGLLVLVLFALEGRFVGRPGVAQAEADAEAREGAAAHAEAVTRRLEGQLEERLQGRLEEALEGCEARIRDAAWEMEDALGSFLAERQEITSTLEGHAQEMDEALSRRVEMEEAARRRLREDLERHSTLLERVADRWPRGHAELSRKMILPTVQLKGNGTVGSGVIVYSEPHPASAGAFNTFILTAYHVVLEVTGDGTDHETIDQIHLQDGGSLDDGWSVRAGRVVLYDRARDVALILLESSRRMKATVEWLPRDELSKVDVFTRAYAVGCPLGNKPLPTVGEISSKSKMVARQNFWMLSAPTFFGNSGGGVYLADSGEFIGVSSMIYTYGKTHPAVVPHMGLFVPLESIYEWLDGEGYGFIHERAPIPLGLAARLRPRGEEEPAAARPAPASADLPRDE